MRQAWDSQPGYDRPKLRYLPKSRLAEAAPRRRPELGFGATQSRQSPRRFTLHQSFQARVQERRSFLDAGIFLGIGKQFVAVEHTRDISKKSMVHNGATPDITVDPETYEVTADGELLTCAPAEVLPMAQRYFLF